MERARGFTFMEGLVVLIIVSILAAAAIPTIRYLLTESRLKAAAETFSKQVQLARSEAIQRQQDVYLVFKTGDTWCYGIHAGSTCSCSPSNTCDIAFVNGIDYSGVTATTTGFAGGDIYFDSIRALPDEAANVNFSIDNKTITVQISQLGKIAICATNVTGYPAC